MVEQTGETRVEQTGGASMAETRATKVELTTTRVQESRLGV